MRAFAAGAAGRHQGPHPAGTLAHEEEPVAADVVHVGIDGGDRCRHRHHGFERVAALGEDAAAGFGGGMVGCGDDAAAVAGGVKVHSGARETKAKRIRHERLKTPVVGTIPSSGHYPRSVQSSGPPRALRTRSWS